VTSGKATGGDCPAAENEVASSALSREIACPSSERGLWEDMVDVGVHTGEAVMDGRGRKPHVAMFRGLLSAVGNQAE
jgi:hypothetical protein